MFIVALDWCVSSACGYIPVVSSSCMDGVSCGRVALIMCVLGGRSTIL